MQKTRLISADRAAALILIVVFAAYGLYGSTLESSLGVDYVGPDFFPKAVGILGVLLAVLLLVQDRVRTSAGADAEAEGDQQSPGWIDPAVAVPLAMMVAYVLSLEYVGFPIASAVFLTVSARFLGCPSWLWSVVFGIASTVVAVLVFRYGFVLRLPQGVFLRLW
jgi:putative tricarboxylic transport membrane protein